MGSKRTVPVLDLRPGNTPEQKKLPTAARTGAGSWTAADRRLGFWLTLYALLFLALYPQAYLSVDEATTYGMLSVLRRLTIYPAQAGVTLPQAMSPVGPHGHVYWFPIGFPVVLAGASLLGLWTVFLVNPALHLIATWRFAALLKAAGIPAPGALLYLFYPGFVLYDRTLFSDGFAASLTTIALSLLAGRKSPFGAGALMGLALASRSLSLIVVVLLSVSLLAEAWREHDTTTLRRGRFAAWLGGLLPFVVLLGVYNFYAMGSPLKSAYSAQYLTVGHFLKLGPLYLWSLLLIYPGMLLAPLRYRGLFWREGLAATALGVALAGSYIEATYGENPAQTLLAVSRQVLPVMPFLLLAYGGVLAAWLPRIGGLTRLPGGAVGLALFLGAAGVSWMHQSSLRQVLSVQAEMDAALPRDCIVYANKDAFKLHFWKRDGRLYRELPFVRSEVAAQDLRRRLVFVVLYTRARGVANEDGWNRAVLDDLGRQFQLQDGPPSAVGGLRFYVVAGTKRP